jgi:hypothetical protein
VGNSMKPKKILPYNPILKELGIRFLHFTDGDVKRNMEGVISGIENWIKEKTHPFAQDTNPPLHPSREGTKTTKETPHDEPSVPHSRKGSR